MKQLVIVTVIGFVLLFFFCYIGEEKTSKSVENNSNSEEVEIEKEDSEIPSISSCPNCVYAIFSKENRKLLQGAKPRQDFHTGQYDTFKDEDYKLSSYEEDYRKLIEGLDEDKRYFFGFILDDNGIIQRAFACGIENKKPFCVEGRLDRSAYDNNRKILIDIFGEYEEKGYKMGCLDVDGSTNMNCYGDNVEANLSKIGGGVLVGDGYIRSIASCTIFEDGYIYCND